MSRSHARIAFLLAALLLVSVSVRGQVATGFPPYGSFSPGTFDTVNNANLNVHFSIPVISKAGRGLPFSYALTYDRLVLVSGGVVDAMGKWLGLVRRETNARDGLYQLWDNAAKLQHSGNNLLL